MNTGRSFSRGCAAKTWGFPSGQTVGMPDSARVSLLAFRTAVPSRQTRANTESFISFTLATACPGLYASSLITTRNLRPCTPPPALTWRAQVSAASEIDPQAAAGPESGALMPSAISSSVTPGAGAARADEAKNDTAIPASTLVRMGFPRGPTPTPRPIPAATAAPTAESPWIDLLPGGSYRPRSTDQERAMERKAVLHRWESMPTEQLNDQIGRRMITGDRMMVAHIYLKKGAVVPKHQHENEQITYVLQGALRFRLGTDGNQEVDVRSGEILTIPPNLPHTAEALEDTLDVDIFDPPRQDWLDGNDAYLRGK